MRQRIFAIGSICAMVVVATPAQKFTTLHNFNMTDGYYPAGMLQDRVLGARWRRLLSYIR